MQTNLHVDLPISGFYFFLPWAKIGVSQYPKCKNPLSSNLLVVGMVLGGPLLGGSLTHHHFLPPCIFTSPQPPMMPPPNCIKNNLNKLVFSLCNAFTVLRFKSLLGKSGSPLSKWVLGGWYTERCSNFQTCKDVFLKLLFLLQCSNFCLLLLVIHSVFGGWSINRRADVLRPWDGPSIAPGGPLWPSLWTGT